MRIVLGRYRRLASDSESYRERTDTFCLQVRASS